jgi:hypothetical protein
MRFAEHKHGGGDKWLISSENMEGLEKSLAAGDSNVIEIHHHEIIVRGRLGVRFFEHVVNTINAN